MKLVFFLLFLGSCATSKIPISNEELLPYKEANQLTKLGQLTKAIHLKNVELKNPSESLGIGHTGVTYDRTPIVFASQPSEALRSFLTRALEMRNVLLDNEAETVMEVYFEEVKVNEVIEKFQGEKAKCSVKANFFIEDKNKKWSGKFFAEFLSASDLREGTERLAPTLASCLNEVVEKLINDNKFKDIVKR